MAQLGARLHGMQKVQGSNPCSSIKKNLPFSAGSFFIFGRLMTSHFLKKAGLISLLFLCAGRGVRRIEHRRDEYRVGGSK